MALRKDIEDLVKQLNIDSKANRFNLHRPGAVDDDYFEALEYVNKKLQVLLNKEDMSNQIETLSLENGKYVLTFNAGTLSATRYGERWRDLTGDNLVLALMQECLRLKGIQNGDN